MTRTVVANIAVTLDGRITGASGNHDMGWVVRHAFSDAVRDHLTGTIEAATTAVMGSVNAAGFAAVWPTVADDEKADARDRAFSRWLSSADKVVFTSTAASSWPDARIVDEDAVAVIERLRDEPGGDIVVFASVSVIMPLLAADVVDRLDLVIVPELLGAGRVLFEQPLPASSWTIESLAQADTGALAVRYRRVR